MPPVPRVTVVSDTNSPHLLQIFAGMHDLAAAGRLRIGFRTASPFRSPSFDLLWVEVAANGAVRRLCFDMQDSGDFPAQSLERLRACDLYFKRSFSPARVEDLPADLRAKVRPYGLNCFFVGSRDRSLGRRLFLAYLARRKSTHPVTSYDIRQGLKLLASQAAPGFLQRAFGERFVARETDIERDRGRLGEGVCYQTRLWDPAEAIHDPDVATLDDRRVAIVRRLREHFRDRFLGGLQWTTFAVARQPDLISPYSGRQRPYLDLLHRARVSVVSSGLHHSTPWKLVESLAAGLCIVTEPFAYRLPVPLEEGVHILTFRDLDECVAHCERLLGDDALARAMQEANRRYYRENVAPAAIVGNCLRQAWA